MAALNPTAARRERSGENKPGPLSYLRVIRMAFEMALRHSFTDAFILFGILVQPLIIAVLGLYMLAELGGEYAIFVVVGSGLTGLWTSLLFVSGNSLSQERWTGTLEPLVGMPTPLWVIVIGKNAAYVVQSLASMVLAYALASLLFGFQLTVADPLLFALSLLFTVFSFVTFGLLLSPLFVANPDVGRWVNGLEYPVYILCGFLFPIALLPGWTTPLSYILAPYWAARALHASSQGTGGFLDVAFNWAVMLLLSEIYLAISALFFGRLIRKARQDATLDFQ